MAEKLFPQRQRCKKCSKGLGLKSTDPVYLGLYCTPRCAGIATPATRPQDAPRECTTVRDGSAVFKRKYRSDFEVPDKILQDPSTGLYWCSHCAHKHTRVIRGSVRLRACACSAGPTTSGICW